MMLAIGPNYRLEAIGGLEVEMSLNNWGRFSLELATGLRGPQCDLDDISRC